MKEKQARENGQKKEVETRKERRRGNQQRPEDVCAAEKQLGK